MAGQDSKSSEASSDDANQTVDEWGTLCIETCIYRGHHDDREMVRCCLCATWVHLDCIKQREECPPGVWPCFKCRVMPTHIGTLINDVSTLTDMLQALTRTVSALKKQYDTEVQTRDQAYLKLTEENTTVRERIAAMHTEKSETQWQNFPKPHGTLLLGSSIIRDIDEKKLVGTKCECIRGGVIKDIQGAVDALPQNTKFARAVLVAGGNDCDSGADTHEVTDILARYQDLISNTKARAFEVSVSSICPRRKSDDVTRRIKDMNAGLRVICEDLGVNFIDNDPAFHLQDGSINDGYLLPDGVHLTRTATNKLASNLRLHLRQGETNAHRDHRKRGDIPATAPSQTATQTGAEGPIGADDFSNPFWNRAHHKANKRFGQPAHSPNTPSLSRPNMPRQPRQTRNFPRFPIGKQTRNIQNPSAPNFPNHPRPNAPHPQPFKPVPLMDINTYPPRHHRENPRSDTQCQLCLGWAHTAVTCRSKDATCYKCHTIGHFSRACPN